jgi:hypothetical protein
MTTSHHYRLPSFYSRGGLLTEPLDAWMLADDVWIALYMYHQEFHLVVEEQRFKKQALQWISSLLDSVVSIRIPSRELFRHVNTGITRLC